MAVRRRADELERGDVIPSWGLDPQRTLEVEYLTMDADGRVVIHGHTPGKRDVRMFRMQRDRQVEVIG